MKKNIRLVLSASAAALIAMSLGAAPASAHVPKSVRGNVVLTAHLTELNGSGASGTAVAVVRGETIRAIGIRARGLTPDAPHAQHIHYGEQALKECPTLALDSNGDGRLNTVEGVPAYGPVVVSLNTSGDTTPASFLDVSRFPVSKNGSYNYLRTNIRFTDVAGTGDPGAEGIGTAAQIAEAVRDGEGVVVIHGNDYDGNGTYNLSVPEGASELDPTLPAEATDPVACGVLH
ncbi:hypothetical protein E3T35_18095 [Cryobacterium sp. TMT1-2-2]|uniref:hypothetical protein n=1 Tax=Cryobacterium sp. TMT1-2-2 TaxID=1259233 RepID=UPI00106B6F36|nr:hypothetical protein [Cryobacterium sp. TMT1-2-2]TFD07926.1 hypothetical protein E3T35_18095 [Cryobacterium sp. TMT1-2-2]